MIEIALLWFNYYGPVPIAGIKRWYSSDVCLTSITYIGPKSRTERPRKTKIGTEVAHVTRESGTTFKVKGQLAGAGAYCGSLLHSLFDCAIALLQLKGSVKEPNILI